MARGHDIVRARGVRRAACGVRDGEETPSADTTAQAPAMSMDTGGMQGGMPMDSAMMHSTVMMDSVMMIDPAGGMRGGRTMAAARDADQTALRMTSGHHAELVRMAAQAMERGGTQTVKDDAHALHTRQLAERGSMVAMLSAGHGEQHQPKPIRMNAARANSCPSGNSRFRD